MNDPVKPAVGRSANTVRTLVDLLRHRADTAPYRVPYRFGQDGEIWESEVDNAGLDRAARTVAGHLQELGVEPGDRVGLLYPPGPEFSLAFWGALYGGLIAVPLAPPQLRRLDSSIGLLREILRNSGARLILTTESVRQRLQPAMGLLGDDCQPGLIATDTIPPDAAAAWRPVPGTTGESIAYLQYSSGSTGQPKGVALPHRAVLANARIMGRAGRLGADDSGVLWLPTFHDMGLLSSVIVPVVHDFTAHHLPPLAFIQRPLTWLRAMSLTRGTLGVAPAFAYELCVRRVTAEQAATLDLSSWRVAYCGAEPIRAGVMRAFARRFAVAGFRPEALFPCYGLAEATLLVSGGPCHGGMRTLLADPAALAAGVVRPSTERTARELVASGSVLDDVPVEVVDPDSLEPVPAGRIGEVLVQGASLGTGYWANPEATEAAFDVAVPERAGRFLRTGDLGFLHDGQLFVTGRRKDVIIVDGGNHYPQDIEAVADAAHPATRPNCCVAFQLDVPDERPSLILVAEVAEADGEVAGGKRAARPEEIEAALRGAVHRELNLRLDRVLLVKHGTIPHTISGKVQRSGVARSYRDGDLEPHRFPGAVSARSGRSAVEPSPAHQPG